MEQELTLQFNALCVKIRMLFTILINHVINCLLSVFKMRSVLIIIARKVVAIRINSAHSTGKNASIINAWMHAFQKTVKNVNMVNVITNNRKESAI